MQKNAQIILKSSLMVLSIMGITSLSFGQNLVSNSGCEDALVGGEIPNWTEVAGTNWTRGNEIAADEGSFHFFAGVGAGLSELQQDVDVSSFSAAIDAGEATFSWSSKVADFDGSDQSKVILEYRDAANTSVLETFDSGFLSPGQVWTSVTDSRIAPVGTRTIRVRLQSQRNNGSDSDGYHDNLSLTTNANLFPSPDGKMYWIEYDSKKIRRSDFDGLNAEDLVTGLNEPYGIALDLTNNKMYWTDFGNDKIQRSDLDGSNVEDLVTTANGLSDPRGIALDLTNNKIYWTDADTDKIQRSDLDGSNIEDLVTGLNAPYGIALDLTNNKMYWTDALEHKVQRSDLDGSNIEDLVTGLANLSTMVLDLTNNKMYWTDYVNNKIQRSNLDGSNVEDIVTGLNGSSYDLSLDLNNSKMYFTVYDEHKIKVANLDGSNVIDYLTTVSGPVGIALDLTPDVPLAVELSYFNARQVQNSIQLNWSTASETENEGFNVYRKIATSEFIQIASYRSHNELLGQGNSTFQKNYTFVDNSDLENGKYYTYVISDVETSGIETKHNALAQTLIFEAIQNQTAKRYKLAQNFPNPFNPTTTISYQIAKDTRVSLKIYNINGEFVKELTNGFQQEGSHSVVWNGTDANGKSVSSGTYFYKLTSGTFTQTHKMILLK